MPRWLVVAVVCLVAILWGANVAVGLFLGPERAVPGLNPVFGSIVGAALLLDRPARAARRLGRWARTLSADDEGDA